MCAAGDAKPPMSPFDVEAGSAARTPAEERHGWLSWMFPRRSVTDQVLNKPGSTVDAEVLRHEPATGCMLYLCDPFCSV